MSWSRMLTYRRRCVQDLITAWAVWSRTAVQVWTFLDRGGGLDRLHHRLAAADAPGVASSSSSQG